MDKTFKNVFLQSRTLTDPGTARGGASVPNLGRLLPLEEECPCQGPHRHLSPLAGEDILAETACGQPSACFREAGKVSGLSLTPDWTLRSVPTLLCKELEALPLHGAGP